jgi:hypothetical protein
MRQINAEFTPDARVTSANTMKMLSAPAAQQGMLLLDPSVYFKACTFQEREPSQIVQWRPQIVQWRI